MYTSLADALLVWYEENMYRLETVHDRFCIYAIGYRHNSKDLPIYLKVCSSRAESIELHAGVPDDEIL